MGWVLPTYNRPEKCQTVLNQIIALGCSTTGTVIMNGTDYPDLRLPPRWNSILLPENIGVCAAMQYYFKMFPDEAFYGLICDDEYVFTKNWDRRLTETAGSSFIAFGNDGWQSGRRQHGYVTWGGDLIRKVGFLSLPGLWHWYHDDVWEAIAAELGLNRFCHDVRVEHRHYRAKQAEDDATYQLGRSRAQQDGEVYSRWYIQEFPELIERLRKEL